MKSLTPGQAAQRVGASKSTIQRAIKSGRLSASKEDGSDTWRIDLSELFRVFDPVPKASAKISDQAEIGAHSSSSKALTTLAKDTEGALKDAEIDKLKVLLDAEKERTAELRAERDRWAAQAERLMLAHVPQKGDTAPSAKNSHPGLMARLAAAFRG